MRGALVLAVDPSLVGAIRAGLAIEIRDLSHAVLQTEVRRVARHRAGVIVHLTGVHDRDRAEAVAGGAVYVDRSALPALGEDEFYDFEILGARVIDPDGSPIGELAEILSTGANDVYVVRTPRGEALAAAIEGVVLEVDARARCIVIDPRALEYCDAPK